jgi:hypothetical protein
MQPQSSDADDTRRQLAGVRDLFSVVLLLLAIIGTLTGIYLIWQGSMIAPADPLPNPTSLDDVFSATPVAKFSLAPQSPLPVVIVTPPDTPTPTVVAFLTATKETELTKEAPPICPDSPADLADFPPGTLCRVPTFTPIPAPTSTPLAVCDPSHWTPNELCMTAAPFSATPAISGGVRDLSDSGAGNIGAPH